MQESHDSRVLLQYREGGMSRAWSVSREGDTGGAGKKEPRRLIEREKKEGVKWERAREKKRREGV